MIRAIAGVLYRSGAPDDASVEELLVAVASQAPGTAVSAMRSGALALACSGGDLVCDGASLAALDGVIDEGLDTGPSSDPLGVEHAVRMERAALPTWHGGSDDEFARALRGDHALVLWDGTRGLLVRDQLGGRSWVLHDDGARLSFATEVNVLLALLRTRPGIDEAAMAHWITLSGMPGDRTLYDGVRRLQAGHLLELDPSGRRGPRRYWSPSPPASRDQRSRAEVAASLRDAMTTAVSRRSAGAGRTGVLLSGGLDSTAIAGIAATLEEQSRPQRSYSAIFPQHPSVDESALITQMAQQAGLAKTSAVVRSGSVIGGGLPYLERWALPPVSPNLFFWVPLQQRAADQGIQVLLDGEGGDELFGTSPYLVADQLAHGHIRAAAATVRSFRGGSPDTPSRIVREKLVEYGLGGIAPHWAHTLSRRVRPTGRHVPRWVTPSTARAFVDTVDGAAWKLNGWPRWWAYLLESTMRGMGPALTYDHSRHRAAMSGGLFPRHPIMDVDVIELIVGSPPILAFDTERSRPVLREAITGLVPEAIRMRPDKSTFDAVFHESVDGPDRPVIRALLGDPGARVGAYVDLDAIRRELLDVSAPAGPMDRMLWGLHTWRLVTAECFLRFQEDPAAPRKVVESAGVGGDDVTLISE